MPHEYVIIANPAAGLKKAPALATSVAKELTNKGAKVQILLSEKRGDITKITEENECPGRIIIACGGDGTIQEVVNGIKNPDTILGIIPQGRCNDFARAIGISRKLKAQQIAEIIQGGKTRIVDCGIIGGRKFLTVATFGFDSEVSRYVETHRLPLKGTPAYLFGVFVVLLRHRPIEAELTGEFGQIKEKILLTATANTPFYGGAMQIAPGAMVDDGVFHICVVRTVSKFTVIRMLYSVFKGTHLSHPAVKLVKSKWLKINTPQPQWICADGESICTTPSEISIKPATLRVIVP